MNVRLIFMLAFLISGGISASTDEEILLASITAPGVTSFSDESPSSEWITAMQGRWGSTTDMKDMRSLREIREAVIAEINAVSEPVVEKTGPENKESTTGIKISEKIQEIVNKYAEKYQISETLLKALIKTESGFNPNAVSRKGAKGLMQLMPVHTKRHNADPFDVETNVKIGTGHLSYLLDKYGDLRLALAAYNAGEGAVDKYGGIPPYKETQQYVNKIMAMLGG